VTTATEGAPPALPAQAGDLYCIRCSWLFAEEFLQGEEPFALQDYLNCPTHHPSSKVGNDDRRMR